MRQITKHRVLVALGLTFALLVVWLFLLFMPTQSRIAGIRADLVSLDQEVTAAKQFLKTAPEAQNIKDRMHERHAFLSQLAASDSLEPFIDDLAGKFTRQGASSVEIAPDLSDLIHVDHISLGDAKLTTGKFRLRCQGRFLDIGKSLETLEKQPYFIDLYAMNITYDEVISPYLACDLLFDVYLREGTHD